MSYDCTCGMGSECHCRATPDRVPAVEADAFDIHLWVANIDHDKACELLAIFHEIAAMFTPDLVGSVDVADDARKRTRR